MTTRLPDDYDSPKSIGNYLKLVDGHNKFRILSSPIIGWLDRDEKKPIRTREKPEVAIDPTRPPKFFRAMTVWSYDNKKIQVFEITQRSIQQAIESLVNDPDFGSPLEYDLKITKTGKDLDTRYEVKALAKSDLTDDVKEAYLAAMVNLEKLYTGENPFTNEKK